MTQNEYFLRMQSEKASLFPPKESYLMTHTANGKNIYFSQLSNNIQRRMQYENMHLMDGMKLENGIPVIAPYNSSLDFKLIPFTEKTKHTGKGEALHFFLDDYKFSKLIWDNLERTTHSIIKYDVLMAPDFSLFTDEDKYHQINKQSIYRSRFITAYWQQCGCHVIPTASWGDVNSFSYCFEGLPEHSVIAVCGIGHNQNKAAKTLWHVAIAQLIEEKKPTALIVYGGKEEETQQIPINVKYIPDFINSKLRKL